MATMEYPDKKLFSDLWQGATRILDTARVAGSEGLRLAWQKLQGQDVPGPRVLRQTFERLGATYIKLGQLIASAPGIFPKEYVEEMQYCLDSVAPIPYPEITRILDREFKGRVNEIFASIEAEPIASASIAQVHGAVLTTGEKVVIKIQRPGIENKLAADLNLLYLAALLFEKLAPAMARTSLSGIVEDFQTSIMEETDFIKEAGNIEEFADFLNTIGESEVVVPRVYHEASTKKVLTMERFYGVPLTDLAAIEQIVRDPEATLTLALNTWFQSLVYCGFFHADVHAGNLMVLRDGRVGFIDFGIVGRMDQKIWKALMSLMEALSTQNYGQLAGALIDMNATNKQVDQKRFAGQLEEVFRGFNEVGNEILRSGGAGTIDESRINKLLIQVVEVSNDNGLKVPREFGLLFKQMLYFDRYVRILAPEMDMMEAGVIPAGNNLLED